MGQLYQVWCLGSRGGFGEKLEALERQKVWSQQFLDQLAYLALSFILTLKICASSWVRDLDRAVSQSNCCGPDSRLATPCSTAVENSLRSYCPRLWIG